MDAVNTKEANLDKLVNDFGFPRSEAVMALRDSNGNVQLAITKLCSGAYAPPPYTETPTNQERFADPTMGLNTNFKTDNKPLYPDTSNLFGSDTNVVSKPPPYSKVYLEGEMKCWENDSPATFSSLNDYHSKPKTEELRCSSCFDEIYVNEKAGPFNKVVKDGIRDYHYDCYVKTRGPRCAYCSFPLSKVDPDRQFSGQFIVYEDKKYHIECYEKYAGPRCSYCFNVIIERLMGRGEYSGCWIGHNNKMFHEECYYKKKQSEERSKNT
eukprot:gene7595-8435_t